MKTLALALTATVLATAASANVTIEQLDINGDRFASKSEVASVLPGLSSAEFRDIDVNRDQRLSAQEVQASGAQTFLKRSSTSGKIGGFLSIGDVDNNGDRFASFSELSAAYPGLTVTEWDDLDINDDNRISATELSVASAQNVLTRHEGNGSVQNLVTLNEVDSDNSGFASLGELQRQFPNLSQTEFTRIDTNRDNRISFSELYAGDAIQLLGTQR